MTRLALALALVAIGVTAARDAAAHPLAPSALEVDERAPGVATARLQTPAATAIAPVWPAACAVERTADEVDDDTRVERFALRCGDRALAGLSLGVDGLAAHDTIALVRVRLADGAVVHEVLGPTHPRFVIPASEAWTDALAAYVWLGVEHLLGGLDHVLFVLGLLFIVRGLRARVLTLTAFTAGHSATLALATAGVVRVPAAPIEVLIALTLIAVALQVVEPPPTAAGSRRGWLLAGGFGLIHGMGFAGALAGAGLPAADLPLALAGFNLGIELGQLAIVAAAVAIAAAPWPAKLAPVARSLAGHAIGALAAMWLLERIFLAVA